MEHSEQDTQAEGASDVGSPPTPGPGQTTSLPPLRGPSRLLVWLGVALLVGVGVAMILPRDPKTGKAGSPAEGKAAAPGTVMDAELTLITSDRLELACLSPRQVGRFACDFSAEGKPRQLVEADTLRPYMTIERRVFLIPGLFLEPNVEKRFLSEPPRGAREQLRRFTAKCKLKVEGRLEGFRLRWATSGAWSEPQDADVATVSSCKIEG